MSTTFLKRQKEMKRQEKQREKAERRKQNKLAKRNGRDDLLESTDPAQSDPASTDVTRITRSDPEEQSGGVESRPTAAAEFAPPHLALFQGERYFHQLRAKGRFGSVVVFWSGSVEAIGSLACMRRFVIVQFAIGDREVRIGRVGRIGTEFAPQL